MKRSLLGRTLSLVVLGCAAFLGTATQAQTASIKTEYLMTVYFPLEATAALNGQLRITNIKPQGGWVEGPRIKAKPVSPAGDWPRVTAGGQLRLDVRATLETEEKELIYMSYNGIVQPTKEMMERLGKGGTLKADENYAWLNGVQAIGKLTSFKSGDHVQYEIFAVK